MNNNIQLKDGDRLILRFHAMSDRGRKNIKTLILPCKYTTDNRWVVMVSYKNGVESEYEIAPSTLKISEDPNADYDFWFMSGFQAIPDRFFNDLV